MGVTTGQWAWRRAVHTSMKDEVRRLQISDDDARGYDGGHSKGRGWKLSRAGAAWRG